MTLVLDVEGQPQTSNNRLHRQAAAKLTAQTRLEAAYLARFTWGPLSRVVRPDWPRWPCTITIADHCRTAMLRDPCAVAPHVKAIVDGLSDYGHFPDDSSRFVAAYVFVAPVHCPCDRRRNHLILSIT